MIVLSLFYPTSTPVQPNILVDLTGRARITDFGPEVVTQYLTSDDNGHTPRWTAPEILNEQGTYSKEADIFSFAMVMIEVRRGLVDTHIRAPAHCNFTATGIHWCGAVPRLTLNTTPSSHRKWPGLQPIDTAHKMSSVGHT